VARERPGKSVLIIHEQHPQAMGCDRRLLALARLMQDEGRTVSLLYRRDAPPSQQSPLTEQLAEMLGMQDFRHDELTSCLRPPPALYKYKSASQLERLFEQGWFDLVLLSVWFWSDPAPCFAELVLPVLRSRSPPEQQPFVALLVDDAHALRASRLAEGESDPALRERYTRQAATLLPRLTSLYGVADAVTHVSAQDQAAEMGLFHSSTPSGHQWLLLRTPLRAMRALPKNARAPHRQYGHTKHIGFLGNGQTATNHQAMQWFLLHCWPELRRKLPGLRLRLVGRPPGSTSNTSGLVRCDPASSPARPHCGWAWGTPYAGREAENGIDELGFYDAETLLVEALSWRIFVAPIYHTTGVNTKLLLALELGIPIVSSAAAAAPLGLGLAPNVSLLGAALVAATELRPPAAIADEAEQFVESVRSVYSQSTLWKQSMSSARLKFREMMSFDPAASDMRSLLRAACAASAYRATPVLPIGVDDEPGRGTRAPNSQPTRRTPPPPVHGALAGWPELRYLSAGADEWVGRRAGPLCARRDRTGAAPGSPTAPALLVLSSGPALSHRATKLLHRVFWRVCQHCGLACVEHPNRAPAHHSVSALTDVWMDGRWSAPSEALRLLPAGRFRVLRFWHAAERESAVGERGAIASSSEELLLPLPLLGCGDGYDAGPSPASAELSLAVGNRGGVSAVWQHAFEHAGFDRLSLPMLVRVAEEETRLALSLCQSATHVVSLNGDEIR